MNRADTALAPSGPTEPLAGQSAQATKSISWPSLAKAGAAALAATATAFNFIGQEAYASYLAHWGFDDGMLPLDASHRVHYGYMAVFESIHTLLNGQVGKLLLLAVFIIGGIQIWITSLVKSPPGDTKVGKWLKRNADRLPRSLKSLIASFGISGLIVGFLYYVVLAAFIGLAVAPFIGEHAAGKWAEKKEDDIQQGCQRNDGKRSVCTELMRDGKVVGTGLILASSTTYIAYFDITAKHGRLIKFENGELTGWMQ